MLRHVVLMQFVDDVTEEQTQAVLDGLAALPGQVDDIRSYRFGVDAGLVDGNADLGVVADFDDAEGYRRYMVHPDHVALITEHIRPILAGRTAVQFELTGPATPAG